MRWRKRRGRNFKVYKNYTGIDYVADFIEAARTNVPSTTFIQSDIQNFVFKEKVHIVFAFASLLHLPKEPLEKVFENVCESLYCGGLFRISLKWKPDYEAGEVTDAYGKRTFYYYDEATLLTLSKNFEIIFLKRVTYDDSTWVEILLKK